MGNPSFIDDVPIKTSIYRECPIFFPYVPLIFLLFVGYFSMFPRESIVRKSCRDMSSTRKWGKMPNLTVFLPLPQMKSTKSTKQCEAVCTREHKASVGSDAGRNEWGRQMMATRMMVLVMVSDCDGDADAAAADDRGGGGAGGGGGGGGRWTMDDGRW